MTMMLLAMFAAAGVGMAVKDFGRREFLFCVAIQPLNPGDSMSSRLVIPPKPTKTKRCALVVFRVVRRVMVQTASVRRHVRQSRIDIKSAWQESKGRAR